MFEPNTRNILEVRIRRVNPNTNAKEDSKFNRFFIRNGVSIDTRPADELVQI
jgi:hypothetical protein